MRLSSVGEGNCKRNDTPASTFFEASIFHKYMGCRFYTDHLHGAFSFGCERADFEIAINSNGTIRNPEVLRNDGVVCIVCYGPCRDAKHTFRANRPNSKRWRSVPKCCPAMNRAASSNDLGVPLTFWLFAEYGDD